MSDSTISGTESTLPTAPEAEAAPAEVTPLAALETTAVPESSESAAENTPAPALPVDSVADSVVDPKIDSEMAAEVKSETAEKAALAPEHPAVPISEQVEPE